MVESASTLVDAFLASHIDYIVMLFWRIRQRRWQTSYNGCWMLLLEWSLAWRSLTQQACRGSFTVSCIVTGSMYQSESRTRWPSWCCSAVYTWSSTCLTSVNQSQMSRHGVISDQLIDDCWTYRTQRTSTFICPAADFLIGWLVGVELAVGLPERPGSQQGHFL